MAARDEAFAFLIRRARQGDEDAIRALIEKYDPTIQKVANRTLRWQLRGFLDPVDASQEVWHAFFSHEIHRCDFLGPERLRRFIAILAHNWVVGQNRRYLDRQKRGRGRVQSLDAVERINKQLVSQEASPSQVLEAEERWQSFIGQCRTALECSVLERVRGGFTRQEIAEEFGISQKSLQRLFARFRSLEPNLDRAGDA